MISQKLLETPEYVADPETGEILEIKTPKEGFTVDCEGTLGWVLGKMLAEEAAMNAIDQTELVAQARAIISNAEKLKKDHQRRLEFLNWRFGPEIEHFIKSQIERRQSKTYKTIYGSVSFRKVAARVDVQDEELAQRYLSDVCPEALITETRILKSLIVEPVKNQLFNNPEFAKQNGFEVVQGREVMTIKTGATE